MKLTFGGQPSFLGSFAGKEFHLHEYDIFDIFII